MRIWHVNATQPTTAVDGVERAMAEFAAALAKANHEVTVWAAADRRAIDALAELPHVDVRVARSGRDTMRQLLRELRTPGERPAIVHFHSSFRPYHVPVAVALRRRGLPYVVSPHAAMNPVYLRRYRYKKAPYLLLIERPMMRAAGVVVCSTDRELNEVTTACHRLRRAPVVIENTVRPPGNDIERWKLSASDRGLLLCLARYDVHIKGLDRLAEIARYSPNLRVVVHGQLDPNADPGSISELVAKAPSNFELAPAVFDDDKWRRLTQANCFVQLSRAEGLSMSLVEAMAIGVPCIVSNEVAGTLPRRDPALALVVDDDMRVAADQVATLLLDDAELVRLSQAASAFAGDRLNPTNVAARLEAAYTRIISSKEPR